MTPGRRSFHCLVNPMSGGGAAPGSAVPVARLLREAGAEVRVTYSPGPTACADLAREAASRGDVVVAVGGDGMLSSVATAVVDAGGVLGVVPSGRGNDFARMLGLSADPRQVAHTLLEGEPMAVDVVVAGDRVVLGSVYAGVDSLASEIVDRSGRLPRVLQYPCAAVRAIVRFDPVRFTLDVDGERLEEEAYTVVVANSAYYGAGMRVAPRASLTDGLLDVVVVRAASKLRLVRNLPRLYDGTHVDLDEVLLLRGRRVSLAGAGVTAYGDGEPLGPLPVTAEVRPASLRVLV
ncbi:MAG TPA: diacylglycerol kinase family protein [Nocardioides sp.]|uniref:diacylglycerol/lipid kinase family protein n=1 Tax=Nocardioides sp. TaxID=35761 RepID=UPI002D80C0E8|nr:diacylglycerol kinase family protein [Nocardioides sp.]HET6651838.1 diacylglycerol kinase family protein [Nocardioides sp.]